MTEITKWIADDGKEFEDYDECRDYEIGLELKEISDAVHLYDWQKRPLPLDESHLEDAHYIMIETRSAFNRLEELNDEHFSVNLPSNQGFTSPGLYFWDGDDDEWKHLEEEITRLVEMREHFYPLRNYIQMDGKPSKKAGNEWVF